MNNINLEVEKPNQINCTKCKLNKPATEFVKGNGQGVSNKCQPCRDKIKEYDQQRRADMPAEKTAVLLEKKREKYAENKDDACETQKKYYAKHSADIIESKKERYAKLANEISPDMTFCKKCHVLKLNAEFSINPKTKEKYKQCSSCIQKAQIIQKA